MTIAAVLYTRTCLALWRVDKIAYSTSNASRSAAQQRQAKELGKRKRAVKMMIACVTLFFLCYAPMNILNCVISIRLVLTPSLLSSFGGISASGLTRLRLLPTAFHASSTWWYIYWQCCAARSTRSSTPSTQPNLAATAQVVAVRLAPSNAFVGKQWPNSIHRGVSAVRHCRTRHTCVPTPRSLLYLAPPSSPFAIDCGKLIT